VTDRLQAITAAIVAGGASSRFGGIPKGLETVGGRRIIDRVIDAAKAIATEIVLVSNAEDAATWVNEVPVVRDVRPERGSLVGIHTALATTNRATLVVAWDMPFVTAELLSLIVKRAAGERFAVIPESGSGLEPFCALYSAACLPFVNAAIDEGDLRVTRLPTRLPSFTQIAEAELKTVGDPATMFFNVNSAPELARAEEIEKAERRSRHR
jgi:molybdopterin-guanine dinucleotide biosynthesis protein A